MIKGRLQPKTSYLCEGLNLLVETPDQIQHAYLKALYVNYLLMWNHHGRCMAIYDLRWAADGSRYLLDGLEAFNLKEMTVTQKHRYEN